MSCPGRSIISPLAIGALALLVLGTSTISAQSAVQTANGSGQIALTRNEIVYRAVADHSAFSVENPAGLIPFFEQLYRHQHGQAPGPVRVLQYGDSHTAADSWTGELRDRFHGQFGNGGSGYLFAGKPWRTYRHNNARSGSSDGWYTNGLVGRYGDGADGLGGISMSTQASGETLYVEAEADSFELFYLKQAGGGALSLTDNGRPADLISTATVGGEAGGTGYYRLNARPGLHRFELRTLDDAPVRIFGWVAENPSGVTYEALGINGAQAVTTQRWDPATLRENIQHRDPALIVLSYGTNDAGSTKWTMESYRDMFIDVLSQFRAAAPTASILVIGPSDRSEQTRQGWRTMDKIEMISEAQRQAALLTGSAFLNLQTRMGGRGSMLDWAQTDLAQNDHVHFTSIGYRLLGDAMFNDLMEQYDIFLEARAMIMGSATPVRPESPRMALSSGGTSPSSSSPPGSSPPGSSPPGSSPPGSSPLGSSPLDSSQSDEFDRSGVE